MHDTLQEQVLGVRPERRAPEQQAVQRRAERPHIDGLGHGGPLSGIAAQLWSKKRRRPKRAGEQRVRRTREVVRAATPGAHVRAPKVGDLGHAVLGQQDIGRLDVAVDDAARMQRCEAFGDAAQDVACIVEGQRRPLQRVLPHERATRHVLEDKEEAPAVRVVDDLVELHDMRVAAPRHRLDLAHQALVRLAGRVRHAQAPWRLALHNLDGHTLARAVVVRELDVAKRAAAEVAIDYIVIDHALPRARVSRHSQRAHLAHGHGSASSARPAGRPAGRGHGRRDRRSSRAFTPHTRGRPHSA